MTMKYDPYLGEWIILPEGATISDEALRKAAAEYVASIATASTSQKQDGTYTHTWRFATPNKHDSNEQG